MTELASASQLPLRAPVFDADSGRKRGRGDGDDGRETPSDDSSAYRNMPAMPTTAPSAGLESHLPPTQSFAWHRAGLYNTTPAENYQLQSSAPSHQQHSAPGSQFRNAYSPRLGHTDSGGSSSPSWESYPIGGGFVPGMNTMLSRTPGLLAAHSNRMMQEFMGSIDPATMGVSPSTFPTVDPLTK